MKGAVILSKDPEFFRAFVDSVKKSHMRHIAAENSIKIFSEDDRYVMLYNRTDEGDIFNEYDIPPEAVSIGYNYAFLAECRSEEMFCATIGSKYFNLDMFICDGDGVLYRPNELSSEKIVL